jgi:hypothetical protein
VLDTARPEDGPVALKSGPVEVAGDSVAVFARGAG